MSMLDDLPPWLSGALFRAPRISNPTVNNTATKVLSAEPQRWMIAFGVASGAAGQISILPASNISSSLGLAIGATTLPTIIDTPTWGPMVQGEWFAIDAIGGSHLTIIENILNFWPDDPNSKVILPFQEDDKRVAEMLAADTKDKARRLRRVLEQCNGYSRRWQNPLNF